MGPINKAKMEKAVQKHKGSLHHFSILHYAICQLWDVTKEICVYDR